MMFDWRSQRLVSLVAVIALMLSVPAVHADSSDEYVAEAQRYIEQGKVKSAVIELKNALKANPTNVKARLLLGEMHIARADGAAAAKEFRRARDLGAPDDAWMLGYAQALALQNDYKTLLDEIIPGDRLAVEIRATLLAMRGNANLAVGDPAAAAQAYDAALAADPDNLTAQLGKAQILLTERRDDEALLQLNRVLEAHPDHAPTRIARGDLFRRQQKLDEAQQDYERAADLAPNDARVFTGLTLVRIAKGDIEGAKKSLESLNRVAKGLPAVHYLQALVSFQDRDFDRASDELQLLLRAAPGNLQAQMLYGMVSYAREEFTIADDYLTRVLASTPGNLQVIKMLGAARLKLRQPDRAVAVMAPVVNDETRDAQLLALLGTAYIQSGDNTRGAELMERAIAIDPDQALLRTQLAVGRIASGDTSGAIAELESAVALGQDLIQADVLLVISYLQRKEFDKALDAASDLEQRMPDSPIPVNLSGLAFLAQKDFDAAEDKFRAAIAQDADFVVARMNLARSAMMQNNADAAEKAFLGVLERDPSHIGAMLGLAALARVAGDDQQAEEWLLSANAADPTALKPIMLLAEGYLRESEPLKATNIMSGLTAEQSKLPGVLRLRGMAQLQSGEYARAAATLTELVELAPESIEAWFQLARAQVAGGIPNAARESFERAIALDADHKVPVVWVGLGELELREKRYDAALQVAEQIKQHFSWTTSGFDIAASAYRGRGEVDQSLAELRRALEIDPSSNRVDQLAQTLAGDGRMEDAITVMQEWLQQHPDDAPRWTRLGLLQQQLGRDDEALRAYEQAVAQIEPDAVLANNMAWLYLERNPERAIALATRAYELAPSRAEIVDTYGWVLYQTGRQREGLSALQQALVISPRNPEIALHVSQALLGMGRGVEARPILQRIVRDHPTSQYGEQAKQLLNGQVR